MTVRIEDVIKSASEDGADIEICVGKNRIRFNGIEALQCCCEVETDRPTLNSDIRETYYTPRKRYTVIKHCAVTINFDCMDVVKYEE